MARIRTVKPEFWTGEQVMECSPITRLLFIGLWNFCDDHGRHPLAPKQIKALVFPGDDITVDTIRGMIGELSTNGLIRTYVVDEKEYFEVTGWHHQKIDKRQDPKYPGPNPDQSDEVDERSSNGIDGKEGRGEESRAEPNGSSGEPSSSTVIVLDARKALFGEGLSALAAMTGKPPDKCRTLVGRWLKAAGDDAQKVHGAIQRAAENQVADAVPWIERAVTPVNENLKYADKHGHLPGDPYYGVDY